MMETTENDERPEDPEDTQIEPAGPQDAEDSEAEQQGWTLDVEGTEADRVIEAAKHVPEEEQEHAGDDRPQREPQADAERVEVSDEMLQDAARTGSRFLTQMLSYSIGQDVTPDREGELDGVAAAAVPVLKKRLPDKRHLAPELILAIEVADYGSKKIDINP